MFLAALFNDILSGHYFRRFLAQHPSYPVQHRHEFHTREHITSS